MDKIAILASGSGSNAENIARYFSGSDRIRVSLVITNNPGAGVIERAVSLGIPYKIIPRNRFREGSDLIVELMNAGITYIVLAGFLQLVPGNVIEAFKGRIINIHPALLPLHGGKGFYGENVHQAVINSKSIISGITIHHVNNEYDKGEIIFQAACHVSQADTAQSLAAKIHRLEYAYFPVVIEKLLKSSKAKR